MIASVARTATPKLNVVIDGNIIRQPSLFRSVPPTEGGRMKNGNGIS
jgi:hypothetical protein